MYGELVPTGGGDIIQLKTQIINVGRRETNDIVLRFPNVSGNHSQLTLEDGYWKISDLGSSNGTKVNGRRIQQVQTVMPGDKISFAKHEFTLNYSPTENGAVGAAPPAQEGFLAKIFGQSLLERAGLTSKRMSKVREYSRAEEGLNTRYNLDEDDDDNKEFRNRNKPL